MRTKLHALSTKQYRGSVINLYPLAQRVREHFQIVANQSFVVQASIPILYFGDCEAYYQSPIKVVTVGLNPSRKAEGATRKPKAMECRNLTEL